MQQVERDTVPRESLGNLLCYPFRGGMGADIKVNHPPSLMSQYDENEQQPKGCRWHYEEVGRSQL